ncbi:hypothetical protein [Paenibacillus sp. NEAU-GSW1]|uniref:hypothetical protein n=1 Tax=Paenibacillus sp. NEAU-GSW1 TaxID=2682486 RepID=UPI0012E0D232|nr:hypothetical protein [Paenibacillus sp. NEAU-GSW1]MUT64491.1 hypothetical protein [Paenibacillus sp. NEAU-GSW1]
MHENDFSGSGRKTFYVSVQAGQVLQDGDAAAYELVINATDEEADELKQLFNDLSSMDEAQMFHFVPESMEINNDARINDGYDSIIQQIYQFVYDHGTDETRRHIEGMEIL